MGIGGKNQGGQTSTHPAGRCLRKMETMAQFIPPSVV
jgi:hypothetical protein